MPEFEVVIKATVRKTYKVTAVNKLEAVAKANEVFSVVIDDTDEDYKQEVLGVEEVKIPTLEWKPNPEEGRFTFDEALAKFGKPNAEGWRLPTKKEAEERIQSLSDEDREKESTQWFWTSTIRSKDTQYAWFVDFEEGITSYDLRDCTASVLLVREVQS